MKFGKLAPLLSPHALDFAKYSAALLPNPHPGWSNIYTIEDKLAISPSVINEIFPMDGNDIYGDCTCAAAAHADTLYSGLVGVKSVIPSSQVVSTYQALTGGPDTGLACTTVLDWWKQNQFGGTKLYGYMVLQLQNHIQVEQAIDWFGGVYLGFTVQANCLSDFNAGKPWTPGESTGDGHCVCATAYSKDYLRVFTWGATQLATWDWWDAQVDEAYVLLPSEASVAGFAPGFDYAQLQADLAVL